MQSYEIHKTKVKKKFTLLYACIWRFTGVRNVNFTQYNVNPYKPSVLFVGHRQRGQNQIRRRKTRRPIRFSTVCVQMFLLKFEQK